MKRCKDCNLWFFCKPLSEQYPTTLGAYQVAKMREGEDCYNYKRKWWKFWRSK